MSSLDRAKFMGHAIVGRGDTEIRPRTGWAGRPLWLGVGIAVGLPLVAAGVWCASTFDAAGTAASAYDRHQYRQSLSAARDHLRVFPGSTPAALMAARSLTRLGQGREAIPYFARAGQLDRDDAHTHALCLLQADQPRQALAIYQEILNRWPDDALALKRLSAVRMGLKEWNEVLALSARLTSIPAERAAGGTLTSIAHHEMKHYPQAAGAAIAVLELDPDLQSILVPRSLFFTNLAIDLLAEGRADEARHYLERGLKWGDDAGLRELLGTAYSQTGDLAAAELCWRDAVALDPKNADAWLDLGRLAMSERRWADAAAALSRAAELSTDAVEPVYNLGLAYQMLGQTREADRYRRLAIERRRRSPPRGGGMGAEAGAPEAQAARTPGSLGAPPP